MRRERKKNNGLFILTETLYEDLVYSDRWYRRYKKSFREINNKYVHYKKNTHYTHCLKWLYRVLVKNYSKGKI